MKNLITVCRNCHALIHAGLLILVGDVRSCEFHTAEGRNLHGPGDAPEQHLPQPPPFVQVPDPGPPPVRLNDVPARIDGVWWRRHANLIHRAPSGGYEFRPGRPLSKEEADATARRDDGGADEGGTVCQPRPAHLADMVGQRPVVESVTTAIAAARVRGEPVDHQLLTGPPGLGKTTMARAIATEMGVRLHDTTGSCLRTADDLVQLLIGLGERDIVFIDEIHGLDPKVTEPGRLTPAFLGRFVDQHLLEYYQPAELTEILGRAAPHFNLELDALAAARRRAINAGFVQRTLDRLGIDDHGLARIQRRYLALLRSRRRPVGLRQAARLLGVDARTLERDHEPYLLRLGLMDVTPNGRVASAGSELRTASLRLVRHPAWTGPAGA